MKTPTRASGPTRRALLWLLAAATLGLPAGPAAASQASLSELQADLTDDALYVSFTVRFELPPAVVDAVYRGLPLHFVAHAHVTRERWYWTDARVASATRTWRLAYQPLTRRYRVTFGALSQNYESLQEALATIQRTLRWRIADAQVLREDTTHRVAMSFKLDTTQLPRPFLIGITGNPDWNLAADAALDIGGGRP